MEGKKFGGLQRVGLKLNKLNLYVYSNSFYFFLFII